MERYSPVVAKIASACLLLLIGGACTVGRGRPAAPRPSTDECALIGPPAGASDTVVMGLTERLHPAQAGHPRSHGERLVFAALYETLIRVDCQGRAVPGLASSWRTDSAGRRWTFTLRDDARFWDGAPVTARDVLASWSSNAGGVVSAASAIDARTLIVTFREAQAAVPLPLADPALAVRRSPSSSLWPPGTGHYRIAPAAGRDTLMLTPMPPANGPVIQLRDALGADARDLLDAGVDLVVTHDPAVLDYAGTHPEYITAALPWERTYVLLLPARRAEPEGTTGASQRENAADAAALRDALARDAVRAEARAAEPPFWWRSATECGLHVPAASPQRQTGPAQRRDRRIVYEHGDRTARDLAERLVALAAFGETSGTGLPPLSEVLPELRAAGTRLTSVPLRATELTAALHAGDELAYVVALPQQPLAPCMEARRLLSEASWITNDALVPLVDTRSRVVVRRGTAGVTVDRDGTLRILGAESAPETGAP